MAKFYYDLKGLVSRSLEIDGVLSNQLPYSADNYFQQLAHSTFTTCSLCFSYRKRLFFISMNDVYLK